MHMLTIEVIIDIFSIIAIAIPIIYFIKILSNKKDSSVEAFSVWAYIPSLSPQFYFGQLKNKVQLS